MKLRLLSLVLLGITLIDVTQARTIEKKEIDYEGAAKLVKMFEADNSKCKCLNHGYCLARKDSKSEYTEVNGCGERKCYTHCDSSGCREVCDGQCECENNRCESCDDQGCKQVFICFEAHAFVEASKCTECKDNICRKAPGNMYTGDRNECNRLCQDDTDDILIPDKCVCKNDENGKEKCQMCGIHQCNPVTDCSRFATCTLDHTANTYRRCYGFNHGESHCRTMYSAVEFKKRNEEWVREFKNGREEGAWGACECPSNGGDCKMCRYNGYCRVGEIGDHKCSDADVFNVTAHLH